MNKQIVLTAGALSISFACWADPTPGTGSFGSSFVDLSAAGVISGGAIKAANTNGLPNAAIPYSASGPISSVGAWVASGPVGNGTGDAVLNVQSSFGSFVTGVSFLWGSPDKYNSFKVTTSVGEYTFLGPAMGNLFGLLTDPQFGKQNEAYYLRFTTTGGETIKSIAFQSPGTNAIEISNVAVVPEPEAYGLALAGMGVVALAMRRRRQA